MRGERARADADLRGQALVAVRGLRHAVGDGRRPVPGARLSLLPLSFEEVRAGHRRRVLGGGQVRDGGRRGGGGGEGRAEGARAGTREIWRVWVMKSFSSFCHTDDKIEFLDTKRKKSRMEPESGIKVVILFCETDSNELIDVLLYFCDI